jgi:hypothetical protein
VVKQQNAAAAMAAAVRTLFQIMWALAREWAGMGVVFNVRLGLDLFSRWGQRANSSIGKF